MVTVSTSPESYHHGSLREALIEAGLAALEGPEGETPSLRALARTVGVSATAVYRHFPNKQALTKALSMEGLQLLAAQQQAALEKAGGGPAGFAETGRAYIRFALAHPALFRLIFTQGAPVQNGDCSAPGVVDCTRDRDADARRTDPGRRSLDRQAGRFQQPVPGSGQEQGRIPVTVKAILLLNRMSIDLLHALQPHERTHQHEKRRFR